MKDARHLQLIGSIFKETTMVWFYSLVGKHWRLTAYKYPGKPKGVFFG